MALRLIPLFPLPVVVFPRTPLPLHIFEDRYKTMVGEAMTANSEFGMVLASKEGIVNAGCTVSVEKVVERYPDGRLDILTRGQHRFEIVALNEEKDYLQGEVTYFDDDDFAPVPAELREQAIARYQEMGDLSEGQARGEPDLNDPQLSFQLAQGLPDLNFLNGLLRQRSESDRLKQLTRYLIDYIPKQRATERIRELAPRNGFGRKLAGL